ncbi:MAG: purine-binding chemotaxis protein CheW [Alteromonadaceae bacterium]|jgi:purine-binding chemotaxis protein CheW
MSTLVAETNTKDEIIQWVTFQLSDETYGIRVLKVQEVQRYSEISPIPGAPSYVLGIINLRGSVISVLNTREKFGLPNAEPTDDTRIVILESGDQVVGIMVDCVAEVVSLATRDTDEAPNVGSDDAAKFIDGVSNKDGKLVILLDSDKILNEEEWQDLANL